MPTGTKEGEVPLRKKVSHEEFGMQGKQVGEGLQVVLLRLIEQSQVCGQRAQRVTDMCRKKDRPWDS